jgi:hypothetical protein
MPESSLDNRNVLNAVASVKAGQEQMQKDVDRLRASSAATLTLLVYCFALGGLAIVLYTKSKG